MNSDTALSDTWMSARRDVEAIGKLFRQMEQRLKKRPSLRHANKLIHLAVHTNSSIYYSEVLEDFFLDLARQSRKPLDARPVKPSSVLHVMTTCLLTGGHTRIVERWIQSAPADETHSVVLIRQIDQQNIPDLLKSEVNQKNGSVIQFNVHDSIEQKANELRQLGMEYEHIVLHHHMQDPVPLMAFGLPEFTRPVITFNHAGHMFWVGCKATDLVIDIEESQQEISHRKRGLKNSILVDLPYELNDTEPRVEKALLRTNLGLPVSAPIVISMASAYKYTVMLGYNYPHMLGLILDGNSNAIIVIIGVKENENEHWRALVKAYPDRVHLLGTLPHGKAVEYLQASDLYLDSYPYNSFTALLDATSLGRLPALTLATPVGTLPFIKDTSAVVGSETEMVDKVTEILGSDQRRVDLLGELQNRIATHSNLQAFQNRIHHAYKRSDQILNEDDNRMLKTENLITAHDILTNEIFRLIKHPVRRKKRLGIILKQKTIWSYSISVLGMCFYSKKLTGGSWERQLMGLRLPATPKGGCRSE